MSVNKNAVLRYNKLDKCFSNYGRKYYFDDLLNIVNEALIEEDPTTSGIQVRQLREDIRFMKSDSGYSAPILAYNDGKRAYYRYEEKDFSINNSPLNSTEAEQLKKAVSILQRFEGAPEFEWINEITPMINDQFGLKDSDQKVMAFESNIDYKGHELITPLFNAIVNKRVLEIQYTPFGKEPFSLIFHPYYLKQYNNRWFVLGFNEELELPKWIMPLDRISSINETDIRYKINSVDWEDHFYDIIGVTRPDGVPIEVKLIFSKEQAPYVQTKPLHPSQKERLLENSTLEVRINVVPNFELETMLLSFGDKVMVKSPESLRESLICRLKLALNGY